MEDKQNLTEQQKILLSKLETLRAEMHRSVDARVDRSIQHILTSSVLEESPTLPLHTDPSVFKGKKPEAVLFPNGQSVRTTTWKSAVLAILQDCNADPTMHTYLMELRGKVMGRQRTILAASPEKMHAPLEIDKELYMESYYDTASLLYVLKNRVLDEVGYGWLDAETEEIVYNTNGMPDITANEMYHAATVSGTIDTIPEAPGLAVWHDGHIGVYIGNGEVVEAMGTRYGVVKTKLEGARWTHWLKIPYISYD